MINTYDKRVRYEPNNPQRRLQRHVLPLSAVLLPFSLIGSAGPATGGEGFAMLGIGGSTDVLHSYQGLVYAPGHSLADTGPVVHLWSKSYGFTYETDLPQHLGTTIKAIGVGF